MHYSASHGCHLIQSSFLWGWDIVTPVCAAPNSYSEKKGAHMCNHNDSSNISLCSSSGISSKGRRGHICELATATMGLVATSCQQWWQNQLQRKNGTQTRAREHERGLPSLKSAWHINWHVYLPLWGCLEPRLVTGELLLPSISYSDIIHFVSVNKKQGAASLTSKYHTHANMGMVWPILHHSHELVEYKVELVMKSMT